jgi:hypothetical protein
VLSDSIQDSYAMGPPHYHRSRRDDFDILVREAMRIGRELCKTGV